jgi:hypothetical protein
MVNSENKKLVIGISGYARSGKDTLAGILKSSFTENKIKAKIFSFAFALKNDIDNFCLSKIGISAFTEDTDLKSRIRPMLISYGQVQRGASSGTYWLKKLKPEIDQFFENGGDVTIVSDLRFKEFEFDETDFIKSYKNNAIVTVSRIMENGMLNVAAHESELENLPRISKIADFELTWNTNSNTNSNKNELNSQSKNCLDFLYSKIL